MNLTFRSALFMALFLAVSACSKPTPPPPTPEPTHGTLSVTVVDAAKVAAEETDVAVAGALLDVYDAEGQFVSRQQSDVAGNVELSLLIGTYTVRVAAQNYQAVPGPGVQPIPFAIAGDEVTSLSYQLKAYPLPVGVTELGQISGSTGVSGALIVALGSTYNLSTLTNNQGEYVLFNVPADSYDIKAHIAGYDSSELTAVELTVDDNLDTLEHLENQDLTLTTTVGSTISGSITYRAVANAESVDVTLLHPVTREVIPGLSVDSVGTAFSLENVPNGNYYAWASLLNDGYVMDYATIMQEGGEEASLLTPVTAIGSIINKQFDMTSAVSILSPTNAADTARPSIVETLTPTFSWVAHSGIGGGRYALELVTSDGVIVWGGISNTDGDVDGTIDEFGDNAFVAVGTTEMQYPDTAPVLEEGVVYRWRVFALNKDAIVDSVSEDLMGLFTVVLPEASL